MFTMIRKRDGREVSFDETIYKIQEEKLIFVINQLKEVISQRAFILCQLIING